MDLNHWRCSSMRVKDEMGASMSRHSKRVMRSNRSSIGVSRICSLISACKRSVSFKGMGASSMTSHTRQKLKRRNSRFLVHTKLCQHYRPDRECIRAKNQYVFRPAGQACVGVGHTRTRPKCQTDQTAHFENRAQL